MRARIFWGSFVSLSVVTSSAIAQDAAAKKEGELVVKSTDSDAGRKDGWAPGALFGGTFNFTDTRSVVGQPDGSAVTLGAVVDGVADYNRGPHEWRNALALGAGVSRTPAIDEWIKTRDNLAAETIYLYHVVPSFGPFVRVAVGTPMFAGSDIRPAAVNYVIARLDGTTEAFTGRRLALTDPFQPLTLKESLGAFVQPLTSERIRLEARAGLGAQEVFAEGALAVNDDEATADVLEVKELDSFNQLGIELVANVWGTIDEAKRVAYTVGAGILVPLAYSALPEGDDRGAGELTNIEVAAGLSVKVVEWASLDYKLAVLRQPQLLDATQVTNNVLLTLGLGVGSKAPVPPPPPPKCEPEPVVAPPAPAPAPAPTTPAAPPPAAPPPAAPPPAAAPPAAPPPPTPAPEPGPGGAP